jgi:hypothetical protein
MKLHIRRRQQRLYIRDQKQQPLMVVAFFVSVIWKDKVPVPVSCPPSKDKEPVPASCLVFKLCCYLTLDFEGSGLDWGCGRCFDKGGGLVWDRSSFSNGGFANF